jgi:hypothetical protein
MAKRASIFDNDLDLSGFAPKEGRDTKAPPAEIVKQVAEAANFRSREPKPDKGAGEQRKVKGYRTGRNVQFNVKATQETLDTFHLICEKKGWLLAEGFAEAVAALKRAIE